SLKGVAATWIPHGDHDRKRLSSYPSRHQAQDLTRGAVQPLGVLDEAEERSLLCCHRQQTEYCKPDQEAIGGRPGGQAQRNFEGAFLRRRELIDLTGHGRAELVDPREGELHLRLDTCQFDHPKSGSLTRHVTQERCLSDARITVDQQRLAGTPSCARKHFI